LGIAPAVIFIGSLVFLAHLFAVFFERTRIPDVFFLILIGLVLGPVLKIVTPEDFGRVGSVLTAVALVVILFESGIALELDSLKNSLGSSVALTLINFFAAFLIVTLLTWWLTPLTLLMSAILASIVGGTSSAVVIPIVRSLNMHEKSRTVLLLESVLSDVLCIVITLALVEVFKYQELKIGIVLGRMVSSFLVAILLGVISAVLWSFLLIKVRQMKNSILTTPALVVMIYGITEFFGYSGAIACLSFGFTLGHTTLYNFSFLRRFTELEPVQLTEMEKAFFSEIVFLIKTFFFVYVGISIVFTQFWTISMGAILTLILFLLRIPAVRFSIPNSYFQNDVSIMAIMVPKGLVAAVLAGVPLQESMPNAEWVQAIVYAIVLFSIMLCTLMIFLLQRPGPMKTYSNLFPKHNQVYELHES